MVVGTASSIAEALLRASELRPDVVLIDIALGTENGFDLARRLAGGHASGLAVIMISSGAEDDYADLVAASPALGFLPKAELSADGIRRILGLAALMRVKEGQDGEHTPVRVIGFRQAKLRQDAADMLLHRSLGHPQLPRDPAVREPFRHEGQNLALPGRQHVEEDRPARRAATSSATRAGSTTEAPRTRRFSVSTKSSTLMTRLFSR